MIHVAVLWPEYLDAVLDGRKTIESRLARTRCAPFGVVTPGDTVYLKQRSGPIRAAARVSRVMFFEGLTPRRVDDIRRRFGTRILGGAEYWAAKRVVARVGTLVWLTDVRRTVRTPAHPPFHGRGWLCLGGATASVRACHAAGT